MAMRPRTPPSRTQPSVRPVYENFQPKSEMKENEEAYFLHIYLPGFIKERIKINYVSYSGMLRVLGERPIVGDNKWSRFDQSYPVPENCEVERLEGTFEKGTLIVTMPKKLTSQASPRAQVETTTKEKGARSPKIAAIPPKSTPTRGEAEPIGDKKSASSPSIVKGLKELKGTQKSTSPAQRPKDISHGPNTDDNGLRTLNISEPFVEPRPQNVLNTKATASTPPKEKTGKPQKGQREIEPKPPLTMDIPKRKIDDEKRQEEIRQKTILETVKQQLLQEKAEKERVKKKEAEEEDRKPYEARKLDQNQKYVDHNMVLKGKEIKVRKDESPKGEESSAPKAAENKDKETSSSSSSRSKGIKEVAASASEVVRRIGEGKWDDQDKPLVANMGAAILVIVALGAYVTYKFTSSDRT